MISYEFSFVCLKRSVKKIEDLIPIMHCKHKIHAKLIIVQKKKPYNIHSILSSIGAFGWKTERARANSSKPSIPLCFVSNKSNT